MRLLKFLTAGKKMEEIKMALVGKYVFYNLKDNKLQDEVVSFANKRFKEGYAAQGYQEDHNLDEVHFGIKYLFYALAMMELGIGHNVKKFQWSYVRNPIMIRNYDKELWEVIQEVLEKKHGIKVFFSHQDI